MATETEPATNRSGEHHLLAYRVNQHELWIREMRDAIKSIDKSLQMLSLVEGQYVAARLQITELEKRLHAVEEELPTLKLARKWVLAAMTSGGAAVGAGVLALVVK